MRVEWHGQSAFTLDGTGGDGLHRPLRRHDGARAGAVCGSTTRRSRPVGSTCCWSPTSTVDHNGVEAVGGEPTTLRSTAGRLESSARRGGRDRLRARRSRGHRARSQHDLRLRARAGCASSTSATSARASCAPEQRAAIDGVDLMFVPVGGGPTIGADARRRDRRAPRAALDRADALPHGRTELPRERGGVRRADLTGRAPRDARLRDR